MKKVVFTCFSLLIGILSIAQTGDFIFVNPTEVSEGVMYKLPDGSGFYTVLPKNTLYSISRLHNMSVEELQSMNGLSGTTIMVGQKLKVKATNIVGRGLALGNKTNGEGVNTILEKSHLKISNSGDLEVSANHPALLRAQKLKEEGIDLESMKGTHIQREDQWWYVANDEDNFHLIATKYDMSFDVLRDKNELNDYLYRKGMVLLVEPGKLFGVKMMPEVMPELPKEEIVIIEASEGKIKDISTVELGETTDSTVEEESTIKEDSTVEEDTTVEEDSSIEEDSTDTEDTTALEELTR